jgi:hypothetical protein
MCNPNPNRKLDFLNPYPARIIAEVKVKVKVMVMVMANVTVRVRVRRDKKY